MYLFGDIYSTALFFIALGITVGAQAFVKNTYKKYKRKKLDKKISGFEVARKILDKNGLKKIHIVETKGMLGDHYDPKNDVVRLSDDIFNGESVAAASVAAHEVGHALQDKDNYVFMRIRHTLVPIVNFTSKAGYVVLIIGFFANVVNLIWIGIGLIAGTLIFQLVTLPVEFNASKRALKELEEIGVLNTKEMQGAKNMLMAAAMTYVASVAAAILQLARLLYLGNRRR